MKTPGSPPAGRTFYSTTYRGRACSLLPIQSLPLLQQSTYATHLWEWQISRPSIFTFPINVESLCISTGRRSSAITFPRRQSPTQPTPCAALPTLLPLSFRGPILLTVQSLLLPSTTSTPNKHISSPISTYGSNLSPPTSCTRKTVWLCSRFHSKIAFPPATLSRLWLPILRQTRPPSWTLITSPPSPIPLTLPSLSTSTAYLRYLSWLDWL